MPAAAADRTNSPRGPRLTADERRDEIVAAAIEAFAVDGFAGTSTETIARRVGVSQPYLFRLFGTKQQLFVAAFRRTNERIAQAFEEAAGTAPARDRDALLMSMGMAYHRLLTDRSLLRLQLQAFALAAGDDPVFKGFVRDEFARLIALVGRLSGASDSELHGFFAEGMLLNVAAAMDLPDAVLAWEKMCEGGSERRI